MAYPPSRVRHASSPRTPAPTGRSLDNRRGGEWPSHEAHHEGAGEERARPASSSRTCRCLRSAPSDVLIRVEKAAICGTDVHIYEWDAVGAAHDPPAADHRPRVRGRASRRSATACSGFSVGERVSGEGHIVLRRVPQLPGRASAPVHEHRRRRREPRRLLRRVPRRCPPATSWHVADSIPSRVAAIFDPFGNADARHAVVRPRRRGRAHHGRRAHRHHGRRRSPSTSARATWSSPT